MGTSFHTAWVRFGIARDEHNGSALPRAADTWGDVGRGLRQATSRHSRGTDETKPGKLPTIEHDASMVLTSTRQAGLVGLKCIQFVRRQRRRETSVAILTGIDLPAAAPAA